MRDSSALGGKTARACDSCLIIRARWFCAADDAFLCHSCDSLVHSANQLASRHQRVRLQTSSTTTTTQQQQAWHSGFTRKARTPRHHNNNNKQFSMQQRPKDEEQEAIFNNKNVLLPLVPELGGDEPVLDDDQEDMLCRVPVFDPFDSQFCSLNNNDLKDNNMMVMMKNDDEDFDLDKLSELLPSDADLAEFAADVESLLEEDSREAKGSKIMIDCKEEDETMDGFVEGKGGAMVKVKDEEVVDDDEMACHLESILDMASEGFDWNLELESMGVGAHEEEEEKVVVATDSSKVGSNSKKERFLSLNYEEVIAAWATQGSPWTTGNPPQFNSHDCWPDYFLGMSGADVQCTYGEMRSIKGHQIGSGDGGREARVSRYKEKRRTRLFAKKIRYEVRKLNAEKRPRMKGRFVKITTSFVGATTTAFPPQLPLTSK